MNQAMSVLEAHDLTKEYRDGSAVVRALRGVSLSMDRGQVVSLEGRSGSGKTTLLSILGCILTPTSGTVAIDGQAVDARRPTDLSRIRKRFIGFVFQHYNLIPSLTARENVEYALNIRGHRGRAARREAQRVIDLVGLSDRAHAVPSDLSGGEKQRVAIARAVAGNAPLLLADEPTANLDTETGQAVLSLLRDLARNEGRAVLIVTHDPKVRNIADRVLRIADGVLSTDEATT